VTASGPQTVQFVNAGYGRHTATLATAGSYVLTATFGGKLASGAPCRGVLQQSAWRVHPVADACIGIFRLAAGRNGGMLHCGLATVRLLRAVSSKTASFRMRSWNTGWPKPLEVVPAKIGQLRVSIKGDALYGTLCGRDYTLTLTTADQFGNPRCVSCCCAAVKS